MNFDRFELPTWAEEKCGGCHRYDCETFECEETDDV